MTTPTTLVLEERLRLSEVNALHATLRTLLDGGAPVCIDGSRVKDVDSATLQLFASLWRSAAVREFDCSWSEVSEPLRRAARLTGVSDILSLPPGSP